MKNALIVIDIQKPFINKATKHIPKKVANFIEIHGKKFDYILFFRYQNAKNSNFVKILKCNKLFTPSETKIAPELKRFLKKDNVFVKRAFFSVFRSKEFNNFLKNQNITKLYFCGLDTDACVFSSAMEAFERGYNVKLLQDLCGSHHGTKYHKASIASLKKNLGKAVINSKEV